MYYIFRTKHIILNYMKHILHYLYIYYIITKFLYLCISMFFTKNKLPSVFSIYFGENALIHHHDTQQKTSILYYYIFWIWKKNQVLNFGIISQLI